MASAPLNTGAYDPSLEERLRHEIQHLWKVTVYPKTGASFDLAVEEELSVSFSLGWSPYAQTSLTVKTPTDPAQRAALDGRLRTYVSVRLGYALDGSSTNMNEAVRLRIQDVDEDVIGSTMKLSLQGDEMHMQDASWYEGWNTLIPRGGVREAIEYVLGNSFNGPITITGLGGGYRADLVAELNPGHGEGIWSIAAGLADAAGLKLWHDGLTAWRIGARYDTTGESWATMLRTGKTGTITSINRSISRTPWFNEVRLVYKDVDDGRGLGFPLVGTARISDGPFGTLTTGSKCHTETIDGWTNQAGADTRARAILASLSARGYSYTIQAAAAYWIRPGTAIPVKTGTGPYEVQVVESVTFTPLNGLMTVTTIKNEDVTIA